MEGASPIPSREVSVGYSRASSDGDAQGQRHSESESESVGEVVRSPPRTMIEWTQGGGTVF